THLLRERHHLVPGQADYFNIRKPDDVFKAQEEMARTLTSLLAGIATISLVVGGVGIMNIMLVSVTERTREIGLRMAVGARDGDIRRQFLAEAVVLCLGGGALGALIGVLASRGIPDNASKALLDLLATEPAIRLLTVTREGEAFAIASGLWVGGRTPVVLIQNTGLLEAGDALRGTAMRMRVPLVCLVTVRGHARMAARGLRPSAESLSAELLSEPGLDSVALLTDP